MAEVKDLISKVNVAWQNKDEETMRECLHTNHYSKGPMVEVKGQNAYIEIMMGFPFESSNQNDEWVAEGNKAVHVFDWVVTALFKAAIPMTEVFDIEGDKVKRTRLFFDTALFPAEIRARIMGDGVSQGEGC